MKVLITLGILMCWAMCRAAAIADETWEELIKQEEEYDKYKT